MHVTEQPFTIDNLAALERDYAFAKRIRKPRDADVLVYRLARDLKDAKLRLAFYERQEVKEPGFVERVERKRK